MRLIHGIGAALSSTLVYSISASICEENETKSAMGFLELSYSLGLTLGPVIASILYHFFGFSLTFLIIGFFILCCFSFVKKFDVNEIECEEINFFKIFFNPVKFFINFFRIFFLSFL